jgi:branched-chain amino acid transport system substrate-binding protein
MSSKPHTTSRRNFLVASALAGVAGAIGSTARAQQPLVINAISSRTSFGAPFGNMMTRGSEFGVKWVNAAGGIANRAVVLNTSDDGSDASQAVTRMQKFAPESSIVLLNTLSSVIQQVGPVANELKVVAIGPAISLAKIVVENRPWLFTTFPRPELGVPSAVDEWVKVENLSRVAVIADMQNAATKIQVSAFEAALKKSSIQLDATISLATQDVNFEPAVRRALSSNPDGIVLSALPNQAVGLLQSVRNAGSKASIFLPTAAFVPAAFKTITDKETFSRTYSLQVFYGGEGATEASQKFVQGFQKQEGVLPDGSAAFAFELILLLQDAAKAGDYIASDTSENARNRLRGYLENLNWIGPFGRVKMGSDGVAKREYFVVRVNDSENVKLTKKIEG